MEVIVRDNNVDHALRTLKKKMQREGMYREMKKRRGHMKSLQKKKQEKRQNLSEDGENCKEKVLEDINYSSLY